MSDPDWIARGIAVGGVALAGVTLAINRYDSRWKRRHAALEPLREALEELRAPVFHPQDPRQTDLLLSVTTGADLVMLEESIERIPDRRCRARLGSLVVALTAVRSSQQQAEPRSPLSSLATKKLEAARGDLEWLLKRMAVAAQRGVA